MVLNSSALNLFLVRLALTIISCDSKRIDLSVLACFLTILSRHSVHLPPDGGFLAPFANKTRAERTILPYSAEQSTKCFSDM
ncbi:hypothetical protein BT69DRAFT_1282148 [Atractiella rhizophila]|nr:hypothetical protein BT69DRAFT_1282148 [Atractiella rhizophila]